MHLPNRENVEQVFIDRYQHIINLEVFALWL